MNIFISYRRNNAVDVAGRIASFFTKRNFNVFYDIQNMQLGRFPNQIINNIKECDHFILILSPNSLDRCNDEDDWVRKEIETALKYNKNIIPFIMPKFEFPRELPKSIKTIKDFQSIEYNSVLFDYVLEDLERKLTKSYALYENIKIEFNVCHCCRAEIDFAMRGEKCPQEYLGKVGFKAFDSKDDIPIWYVPAVNLKIYNLRESPILLDEHTPAISGKMILVTGEEIQSIMIKTFASPIGANEPLILQPGKCFKGNLQGEFALLVIQAFNNHNGQLNLSINGKAKNIELDEFKKECDYCKNIIGEDYETIRKSIKMYFDD